jgi:hypothetical protein
VIAARTTRALADRGAVAAQRTSAPASCARRSPEGLVSEARGEYNRYVLHPRDGDWAVLREGVARLIRDL